MKGLISFPLYIPGTPYARAIEARARISFTVKAIVEERRKNGGDSNKKGDFLDVLLSVTNLSKDEKVSFVLDALLGGYETTSLLMSMAVYFLGLSPSALQQLKLEHQSIRVHKKKNEGLSIEDYKKMEFTQFVRVSAGLTNAPFMLNLDCGHYINNSKAIREAMCFLMDPQIGQKICYVQFPQRFDGIDRNDRYANRNTVFFDINMKGLDGIQGPAYVGTRCVFRQQALYGYNPPKGPKRSKMVSCDCCPCFGRRKKLKHLKSQQTGG